MSQPRFFFFFFSPLIAGDSSAVWVLLVLFVQRLALSANVVIDIVIVDRDSCRRVAPGYTQQDLCGGIGTTIKNNIWLCVGYGCEWWSKNSARTIVVGASVGFRVWRSGDRDVKMIYDVVCCCSISVCARMNEMYWLLFRRWRIF